MACEYRILDYNYAFDPSVDILPTSEDSEFLADNLRHFFRSKVWRSSGNFVIDSTNNKIDFAEAVAGPEITATVASGNYSPDALEAAIKLALESAGANTYTVTYGASTGLWTLASSGVAFELRWDTGSNAASSIGESIGFDVSSDQTGAVSYTGAAIAIHTEEALVFDLLTTEEIDSIALVFDSRLGVPLTESAEVRIQASATNSWASPPFNQVLTLDQTLGSYTLFLATPQDYRYWRVKIVDPTNPNLHVEIGKVVLSLATFLSHTPDLGFVYSMEDQSKVTRNDYGHEYWDVYPNRRAFEFNLSVFTDDEIAVMQNIFDRWGNVTPICVSFDSTEELFDKDRFFIYGRIDGDLKSTHQFLNYFSTPLKIEEAL